MEYLSIKTAEHANNIADALVIRERELYQYDMNIANYTAMLEALPSGDWPENLVQYKGQSLDLIPDEVEEQVIALGYRDKIKSLLRSEKSERKKSLLVYETLLSQMPTDKTALVEAVDAAVIRLKL